MRFTTLLPLACAITAFVLALFCILAGQSPGFMEDYHIVALNTSTLGHNLLNSTATTSSSGSSPTSIGSWLTGIVENVTSSIENDLNDIESDIADKLAAELGIKQWYSLHVTDLCEGTFSPNATAASADYNVSKCTNKTALFNFDPASIIDSELKLGKLKINLTTIDWPSELTDGIRALNASLHATFVIYCISIAATGLVIILSAIAFFLPSYSSNDYQYTFLISITAGLLTVISILTLMTSSVIMTIFMGKVVDVVTKYGNDIGVYAYKGGKFLALTWSATAVMFLALLVLATECCWKRGDKKREWTEKPTRTRSWRDWV